ncbi:hypothetical protein RI129_011233 [Pyrocoelia pectoralis]|uniref:Alcohol dehydrogenase n=1 Tax=Pyrocoelia pectoralis TaxID=417401 RepID=A0AAN7V3N4_9COLE
MRLFIISISQFSFANEVFDICGKTALVTGGGAGIGFDIVQDLLDNGVKGVTLVDVNVENGKKSEKVLNEKFGIGRVIFVEADISNLEQFENAFKISIDHWKVLDIVINNAGVLNENRQDLQVDINIVGTIQGTMLGFKYMSKGVRGRGGVIMNLSSISGIDPSFLGPVYSATKNFIVGLSRSLGHQSYYNFNGIRVIALCPGYTDTKILYNFENITQSALNPQIKEIGTSALSNTFLQSGKSVSRAVLSVLKEGSNRSVWVAEDDQPPFEITVPDRKLMQKKDHKLYKKYYRY